MTPLKTIPDDQVLLGLMLFPFDHISSGMKWTESEELEAKTSDLPLVNLVTACRIQVVILLRLNVFICDVDKQNIC